MTKTTKMAVAAGLVIGGYLLYRRSHAATSGVVASGAQSPLATGGLGAGTGRNSGFVPTGMVTLPLHPAMTGPPVHVERPTL